MNARAANEQASRTSKIEHLRTENARLQRELDRAQAIFDRLPLGVYWITPVGRLVMTNAATRNILAQSCDSHLPLLWPTPGPDTTDFYRLLAQAAQGTADEAQWLVGEIQAQSGQPIHIQENVRLVRTKDGSPCYYEFTIENITDRREAEIALRAGEERYRSVVEHSPAGVLLIDEDARILFANTEMSHILGMEPDLIVNRRFTEFLHPENTEMVLDRYHRRQIGDQVPSRYEARILRADGASRYVVLSATTFQNSAGATRTAAQVLDVTARTKAEQALRDYTEALEIRNTELDAFADSVAHDLKNPLSTIIGFAEALMEQLDTLSTHDIDRALQNISTMGRKMDGIIDELLIFSRIRRTSVKAMPVDMQPIVNNALERLQKTIAEHKVEIQKPRSWPMALGHGPWIEEVWANYVSNAIIYGGSPPKIELGADLLPSGQIRFWVRDNGNGVEPKEQENIFRGAANRARSKGHGLGLSIVKRIVDKLGGEVAVVSTGEVGEGSVFSFTLPAATLAD